MRDEIALPPPRLDGPVSLEAAIVARRSVRSYAATELTLWEIGQLLWAAQGITGRQGHKRAAPSAGGRCPLEFYVCRSDGVWHYESPGHRLLRHLPGDVRRLLAKAAWDQGFLAQAPVVFAVAAVFVRTTSRYGDRGRVRYVPMDVGHAAQNLLLEAVALGLVSVPVGAFDDVAVAQVLALPADQEPLYLLPVGHPQG
ncbi:MAG TPA: SagB/ThcOx family dehydrogenase [Anaerolineae bacterium]|nr:SagB/ThcOx family dehydrogenase [Anaerolineae bacterium]